MKPGKVVISYWIIVRFLRVIIFDTLILDTTVNLVLNSQVHPAPPNIPASLSGPTPAGPRRGFPLESDGGLRIAPTLVVAVSLNEKGLTIGGRRRSTTTPTVPRQFERRRGTVFV